MAQKLPHQSRINQPLLDSFVHIFNFHCIKVAPFPDFLATPEACNTEKKEERVLEDGAISYIIRIQCICFCKKETF